MPEPVDTKMTDEAAKAAFRRLRELSDEQREIQLQLQPWIADYHASPRTEEKSNGMNQTNTQNKPLNLKEYLQLYGAYRDYMKNESSLVNNRLTWVLTIHGFLYATYGFTIQKQLEVVNQSHHIIEQGQVAENHPLLKLCDMLSQTELFLMLITFVGATISLFGLASISAALAAGRSVFKVFDSKDNEAHEKIFIAGVLCFGRKIKAYKTKDGYLLPNVRGGGLCLPVLAGQLAAFVIPLVLLLSWLLSAYFLWKIYTQNRSAFCLLSGLI